VNIWVDADACPNPIKAIVFRAAERLAVATVLVANHYQRVPPSPYLSSVQVPAGFDMADHAIVTSMSAGDLVVTADVPLAAEAVRHGGTALNPRGTLYTAENIHGHLASRDLMQQLRDEGVVSGGPGTLSRSELAAFANRLDRFLTAHHRPADRPADAGSPPKRV
jgi:hypothetical protein